MATTEIIMLDRTKAYTIDEADPTNVLTSSGFHLLDVRRKIEDYISEGGTAMTMEVVVDAEDLRPLRFLNSIGGYAVFPLYSGTETEVFEGYLVIKDDAGKVCTLDGGIYLASGTITMVELLQGVIAYLQDGPARSEYEEDPDPITMLSDALLAVSAIVNFPGE